MEHTKKKNDPPGAEKPEKDCPPGIIVLDFDGTFIRESILVKWVLFLLLHENLPLHRKIHFFCSSMCRGFLSLFFSSFPATSEQAVKTAFKAFRGINGSSIEKMICHRMSFPFRFMRILPSGISADPHTVHLNPQLLAILRKIFSENAVFPEIRIYSQGSFPLAIRSFLQREDVRNELRHMGIQPEKIILDVNEPEIGADGSFTGRLQGRIRTKYNRIYHLDENCLFIGDDADERVIRKTGLHHLHFINWKKWGKDRK